MVQKVQTYLEKHVGSTFGTMSGEELVELFARVWQKVDILSSWFKKTFSALRPAPNQKERANPVAICKHEQRAIATASILPFTCC